MSEQNISPRKHRGSNGEADKIGTTRQINRALITTNLNIDNGHPQGTTSDMETFSICACFKSKYSAKVQ